MSEHVGEIVGMSVMTCVQVQRQSEPNSLHFLHVARDATCASSVSHVHLMKPLKKQKLSKNIRLSVPNRPTNNSVKTYGASSNIKKGQGIYVSLGCPCTCSDLSWLQKASNSGDSVGLCLLCLCHFMSKGGCEGLVSLVG